MRTTNSHGSPRCYLHRFRPTDDAEVVNKKIAAIATYLDIWLMRRTVNYIRVGYSSTSYSYVFAVQRYSPEVR